MPVEAAAEVAVEVSVEDDRWEAALGDPEGVAAEAASRALAAAGQTGLRASVSFLFADDAAVAELNGRFRGKPAPTNVLSWPVWDLRPAARGAPPGAEPARAPITGGSADWPGTWAAEAEDAESLGDVALAFDTVAREAAEAGLTLRAHALHLCVHGVLHLLGYDHDRDGDAELMEALERRALLAAGLPDPYVARAPVAGTIGAGQGVRAETDGSDDR